MREQRNAEYPHILIWIVVAVTVITIMLAGFDVGRFFELWTTAGETIVFLMLGILGVKWGGAAMVRATEVKYAGHGYDKELRDEEEARGRREP